MSPRPTALALCFGLVLVGLGRAWAAGAISCQAERAGARALVEVTARDLFDRELLRLVELGLTGRIDLEVVLFRRRRAWFDARLAEQTRSFTVAWAKGERHYTLDGAPLPSPLDVAFPLIPLRPEAGLPGGDLYLRITARLEVVTASSLTQVARWLVASPTPADGEQAPATVLPRAMLDYLAADLARTARGGCEL